MNLRESAVDAAPAVQLLSAYFAWRGETFPGGPGSYRVTFPEREAFVPPRGIFLVVSDDDGVDVGCGGIRRIDDDDAGRIRYEVKHVWISPGNRGRGWARELMLALETRAAELGARLLVLDTHDSLAAAARLYAGLGYRRVDAYNDNPNATVWYEKTLPRV